MALPSFKDIRIEILERDTKKKPTFFGDFLREENIERPLGQPDILTDLIRKEKQPSPAVFELIPPKEELPLPSILETKTPSFIKKEEPERIMKFTVTEEGFRFKEFEELEKEGKLTPILKKLEEAGFAPPRKKLPLAPLGFKTIETQPGVFKFEPIERLEPVSIEKLPEIPEKDTLFRKAARFILPRNLELKFGLIKPTKADEIREWGKTVDDYYGRGEDLIGGIITFGKGLTKVPKVTAVAILQASQGHEGASVVDRDWADRYIEDANEDLSKFVQETKERYKNKVLVSGFPIKVADLAEFPQSLAFSLASMGAGLGVGLLISAIPVPGSRVAAWTFGTAASGKVAYEIATYQIMQQYLELKNNEKISETDSKLTLEEENKLKEDFESNARKFGLWEALPEALSNLAFAKILTVPLLKMGISKTIIQSMITKIVAIYGEELITETITQKGQAGIEVEAGLREFDINWIEAFKEVAPQTFILTTILAGTGATIIRTKDKVISSLKDEIGITHPLFNKLKAKIEESVIEIRERPEAGFVQLPGKGEIEEVGPEEIKPEVKPTIKPEKLKPLDPKDFKFGNITATNADRFIGRTFEQSTKILSEGDEGVVISEKIKLEVLSREGNDFIIKDIETGAEEKFPAALFVQNLGGSIKEIKTKIEPTPVTIKTEPKKVTRKIEPELEIKPEVGPLEVLAKPKNLQGVLKQEAESLKQIEDNLGITTLPKPGFEGEQFIRVSEHTQRFKTFFKQNKKVPTSLEDWKQIAELELDTGRSSIGLADEFNKLKGVKPEEELDVGNIFQEIQKDEDLKKKIEASLITTKQKETFLKSLSTEIKDKLTRIAKKGRGLGPLETIQVGKALETFIRKGTLEEKVIKRTDVQLLKDRLRSEARGAKVGFKHGRKVTRENILTQLRQENQDITNVKKQITAYAKENLSIKDRGKANVIIRDAKTHRDIIKAFSRINTWAETAEKIRVRNEIINVQKKAIKSPTLAIDYKDRINEALNEFELRGHNQKTLDRLESTKNYIDERAQAGEDVELPRRIFDALNILARTPFDEIPLRTLEATLTEIKLLDKIGRTKWRSKEALYNAEKEALKTAVLDDVTPINKFQKIKPEIGEKLTPSQKFRNIIAGGMDKANRIDKVITPIDVLMDILDGGKGTYDGAHMRLIKGKVDYNFNRYLNLKDSLQEPVSKLAKDLKLKKQNFEKIGIVAAREQTGGIDKLKNNGFTEEQIESVTLTNEERQLLDKMREVMNSKFPEVTKIMKDLYNQPIGKVENYFSFLTDWDAMDDAEVFRRMGPSVEEFGTPTKRVEAGFTRERKSATEQKIQIDAMNVFMKHTDNVSYLVSMAKDAKMIFEVINSKEYQESAGDLGQLLILEWIDLVVRKGGKAGASQIALLDILRKNIGAGILGLKISSTAIQWTALIDGMGMIGPTWGILGVKNIATSKSWREFILKFPEIKERAGGEAVIREMIEGKFFERLQAKGFIPLQIVDRVTAMSVAGGAYSKKMTELGLDIDLTKEPNKQAMEYAQLVVRRTQSSSLFKDVPLAVSRGSLTGNRSLDRTILQFQNFLLTRWSRIEHDAIRVGIKTRNVKQSVNVLFWIAIASFMAIGTRMAVRRTIDFLLGEEEDEELVEEALRSMTYEITGTVPFLGNIFGSYMFDSELLPIFQAPSGVIQGAKRTISGQSINSKAKGVNQFITSLMKIGGIPGAAQLEQIIRGVIPEVKKKKKFFKGIESFPSFKKDIEFPSFKNIGF